MEGRVCYTPGLLDLPGFFQPLIPKSSSSLLLLFSSGMLSLFSPQACFLFLFLRFSFFWEDPAKLDIPQCY